MAKRPNALGRIEADPKPKRNWGKIGKTTLYVALPLALVTLGIVGTLKYQEFISNVKQEGAVEYQLRNCEKFTDKKQAWLECDTAE